MNSEFQTYRKKDSDGNNNNSNSGGNNGNNSGSEDSENIKSKSSDIEITDEKILRSTPKIKVRLS